MRASVTGMVAVLWGGIALLAHPQSTAASSCHKGCKDEIVACRRSECSGLSGAARRDCLDGCRARSTCTAPGGAIRTLVYVVTECTTDRSGPEEMASFAQRLMVRRGNCDAVTIKEFRVGPIPDPVGICRLFGEGRAGATSVLGGTFQRTGVLPDGSAVLFEVTDEFSVYGEITPDLRDDEKGIFFVRADGSGLRRLGDATHAPTHKEVGTAGSINELQFAISADQRTIAFSDMGPGADGLPALQIFTMDLASGTRRQLTRLTLRDTKNILPDAGYPTFIDDRTIVFEALADASEGAGQLAFSVRADGTDLHQLGGSLVAIPGANIVPHFDVTRGGTHVLHVTFEGPSVEHNSIDPTHYREIFAFDRDRVLQLTNFHQYDTHLPSLGRGRAFFISSADPLGRNGGQICQIFSVDLFGGDLRQLTRFEDPGRIQAGCTYGGTCLVTSTVIVDPVTGTLVFTANCDPLGTNPYGDQVFAMRPDGSGLRQLTALRGRQELGDGKVLFESAGPGSYSAPAP